VHRVTDLSGHHHLVAVHPDAGNWNFPYR